MRTVYLNPLFCISGDIFGESSHEITVKRSRTSLVIKRKETRSSSELKRVDTSQKNATPAHQ